MPTVSYLLYDVFTSVAFAGNPLAVVIDPPELTAQQYATIASELNLSETIFLRTDGAQVTARIFTPTTELPFAGHPTIGAALALHDEGLADDHVTLTEAIGLVEVTISDRLATLTTAIAPESVEVAEPDDIARSLGLTIDDLHPALGPRGWSAGVPFTMVAVRDIEVLGRCKVNTAHWSESMGLTGAPDPYVVAPLDGTTGRHWRARMFAPGFGIAEDPATGAAAAAAVGYLTGVASARRLAEGWLIEQGVEMGRPSEIHVGCVLHGSELVAATVGGRAVRVGRGELRL